MNRLADDRTFIVLHSGQDEDGGLTSNDCLRLVSKRCPTTKLGPPCNLLVLHELKLAFLLGTSRFWFSILAENQARTIYQGPVKDQKRNINKTLSLFQLSLMSHRISQISVAISPSDFFVLDHSFFMAVWQLPIETDSNCRAHFLQPKYRGFEPRKVLGFLSFYLIISALTTQMIFIAKFTPNCAAWGEL